MSRRDYSAKQSQTGISPGMATTSSRRPNYNPGGGLQDSKKPSDIGRKQQAAFLRQNPPATLDVLRREGVPLIPMGVPGGQVLNILKPFRDYTLGQNIDYFSGLKNRAIVRGRDPRPKRGIDFYERSADGYKQYMQDRSAGIIDAAGNLKKGFMRGPDGNIMSTGQDNSSGIAALLQDPNIQPQNMMDQGLGSLYGAPQFINQEFIYGLPFGMMR